METQTIKEEIKQKTEELKSLREKIDVSLDLTQSENKDLKVGTKSDGRKYSVRDNRDRFFFPFEWMKFFDNLKDSQKITFDCLINTGGRINELINIKVSDIDFNNNRIILRVTKVKAKKKEKAPRPRTISISSQFCKRLKKYCRDKLLIDDKGLILKDEILGLLSKPACHIALKNTLKRIEIKDWYMFSIHNIRKTHGNWLKALGVDSAEICTRLGHDMNTFLKSYSSSDIFNYKDKQDMRLILGDLMLK